MDSVKNAKPLIYSNIEQKVYLIPKEPDNKRNNDSYLQKKLRLANSSNDEIDISAKRKAYKEYNNDSARAVTGVIGASIPVIHSLASGITAKGNATVKTGTALITAKNWGLFIAGAVLFNQAVNVIIKSIKPVKDFSEKHPGLTTAGLIISGVEAGRAAVDYGNKAIKKILNNKNPDTKLQESLQHSKILQNKTFVETVNKLDKYAKSNHGKLLGQTALVGSLILVVKNFYDLVKIDQHISKTKENLKQKRFETSKELANDLWEKRNTPKNRTSETKGIIIFSNKDEF